MRRQRGFGLNALVNVVIAVVVVLWLMARVLPVYLEYTAIRSAMDATAADPAVAAMSPAQVRNAIFQHAGPGAITRVEPADFEVSAGGGGRTLHVAYTARMPLGGPLALTIDFDHTSQASPNSP